MPALKPITAAGIPAALQKAERYRLINDPSSAESICLDVLAVDGANQQALVMLLLAITDQFGEGMGAGVSRARAVLPRLTDEYKRLYYGGMICERRAKEQLRHHTPGAAAIAHDWFAQAMALYEQAEAMRPAGNDETILRWNTCQRILARHPAVATSADEAWEPSLE